MCICISCIVLTNAYSLVWLNANRDLSKACRSYLNLYGHISKLRGLNLFYIFVYVQLLILTFCPQFIFQIITIECIVLSKRQHYVTFQPFWHHQISLVIDVYFLFYFLIQFFVYLESGGRFKILKIGLKFRYEVEFEFNLEDLKKSV